MIVDDHRIILEGLRSLIDKELGMEVCGEAGDGRSAVDLARETNPDVVVMDLSMPDLNGIEAIRQVTADCPRTKVVALSMHSDRRFVDGALKAGALGYLQKNCAFTELLQAIRTVMAGQAYLSPGIAVNVVNAYVRNLEETSFPALTAREREVLQLIAEGNSVRSIASVLNVSVKTVECHRQQMMRKLHIDSVAGLTKYAVREGLVSLEG
jgi:two-component system response regulator NreC